MYFEDSYRVDSRDVDHQGQCRPSALLGFLQESASAAAGRLGFSREEMLAQHNCFWMLARIWVEMDRPLLWNDPVTVRTWHRSPKAATVYRDFDLFRGGEQIGQAVSAWVLADYATRKLFRADKLEQLRDTRGSEGLGKTKTLAHLRPEGELRPAGRRRVYYSELDLNGHMNNTRYADLACDALELEHLTGGAFVQQMQIGFLAECRAGEELELWTGADGFVKGVGTDGRPRFEAALRIGR